MGGQLDGHPILGMPELAQLDKYNTHIILSSMYIPKLYSKAKEMGFVHICADIELLLRRDNRIYRIHDYNSRVFLQRLEKLEDSFEDIKSKRYFKIVRDACERKQFQPAFQELYCDEPQYFLTSIIKFLDGLTFLDAGAFIGDTLVEAEKLGIHFSHAYSFEADADNYKVLLRNIEQIRSFPVTSENLALWDSETELFLKSDRFNTYCVRDEDSERRVKTVSVDSYFAERQLGFVKMDIEGAESKALAGGIHVFKLQRPIFAIYIYHSLDDVASIPEMMMREMKDYHWLVRSHAYTYSEIILYGIPSEKMT